MAGTEEGPVRILVSACLLGERVRYDGGHKRDPFVADELSPFVEYVPVCPEVECGLPVPREAMRLAGDPASPRLVGSVSGTDHTGRMEGYVRRKLDELASLDLCGYVCKKGSPSSGMERVRVYGSTGVPGASAAGLFTGAFLRRFPLVPVEEEGRLCDPVLREMFLERIFTLRRFRRLVAGGRTRGRLVRFHGDHKYLLLSHGRGPYEEAGRLVARAKDFGPAELYDRYGALLMGALSVRPTRRKVTDVLLHMAGFFRGILDGGDRAELVGTIERYRLGQAPLSVPLTLFRHHLRRHPVPWLSTQAFLDPHPMETVLRNHV